MQFACSLVLRHVMHAVILLVVVSSPGSWSSPLYHVLASGGIAFVVYHNLQDLLSQSECAGLAWSWLAMPLRRRVPACEGSASWNTRTA